MSVLIVGTTALDSIKTPTKENPRLLGGSASHAAVAASFFAPVKLVGVVGEDFPKKYITWYRKHGIDLAGLQILPGKTFHWSGEYEVNMNNRRTLMTELGVIETFQPKLPAAYLDASFVLLGNIAPALQHAVLDQMRKPKFVVADSMDLWINIALPDLLRLLKRVDGFVLNDSEAQMLTQEDNIFVALKKLHKLGPKYVIIKKGSHGSSSLRPQCQFHLPRLPAAHGGRPHRRGRFVRRRHDGLSRHRQGSRREKHPPRDGLWQRDRVLLLRMFWPERHHEGHAPKNRGACEGT